MSGVQRASKPGEKTKQAKPRADSANAKVQPMPAPAPGWLGPAPAAPFSLAGVQRKVAVGPSNDAYEHEANNVASRVAGGGSVQPGSISPISPGGNSVGQRASQPDDTNKMAKKAHEPPVQREVRPEDQAKDPKASLPLQRQPGTETGNNNKDKQKPPSPAQRAEKPADNRRGKTASGIQRAEKPKEKKGESSAAAGAKNTATKPELPAQRAVRPEDTKKIERDSSAPLQTKNKDENSKEKTSAPIQKESKKDGKEKDAAKSPALQRDHKPDKKADDKAAGVQRESKPDAKQTQEKNPQPPMQRSTRAEDKKNYDTSAVQKMDGGDGNEKIQPSPAGPAAAAPAPAAPSMESVASQAVASKGAGEPLTAGTRSTLESGLGSDLGDVRVHDDSTAHSAADALNARAFTHQNDIWLGRGESQSDTRLMAHEATHVVQQTGSLQRQLVQRAGKKASSDPSSAKGDTAKEGAPAPTGGWDYEGKEGKVQKGQKLVLPLLRVPDFKKPVTPPSLTLPQKTDEPRTDTQRTVWENEAKSGTAIDDKLKKKVVTEKSPALTKSGKDVYFFELKGHDIFITGTLDTIKQRALRPYWDRYGKPHSFQVDHKQELQLGGSNKPENMWLLDAGANMASGRNIRDEKQQRIQNLLDAAVKKDVWKDPPDVDAVRRSYTIEVEKVTGGLEPGGKPETWSLDEIKDKALQHDQLKALTKKEIDAKGLQGTASKVAIYTNPTGGGLRLSEGWDDGKTDRAVKFNFGKMFQITKIHFDRNTKQGSVEGDAFRGSKLIEEIKLPSIPLQELDSVDYGGFISVAGLTRTIQHELKVKGLSPVEIEELELTEKGLVGRGKVAPSIRPFDKLKIDLVIDGDNIYLSKVFSADDFNFPGPIKVTSASLEVFAGTQGIGAKGDVNFAIERVGKGKISAVASTSDGPKIAGDFQFDPSLFDPGNKVHLEYYKGKFSGSGDLVIKPGKIRGIKSAAVHVSFAEEVIDAEGSIQPDIPAVEQADLSMHYDEKSGLTIAGDLQLKKDIPGVADGSIHAEVNKKEDKYVVKAHGEATPKIPGITSKLIVNYDDGAFDATITAGYEKGMLKGTVTAGVTNRPVGDDGKPGEVPAAKADKLIVYGGGSVTLQLAPWLQATAAIRFLPNGEVEVTGKIGLPSVLNLFDEKKVQKNIFSLHLDIPILGFSVLGHNVGIFLEIGGGLDLNAGIGPGQLQDVELSVTYNPAHEENTEVHGHAALHIPAHAGLRLFVSAALGAGIPLVDAKAGLELGGTLGIEGALHAAVDVDWSPKKGLVLDASAEVYAEPKFKFDITGFVLVEVDLLFTTETLYEKRWQLAAVEYGSGLRLGMKLPVHYEEGKPFSVSLSDIQFEVPQIDPMATIKGLFDKIV